jgi:hypothetical protein
MELLPLPISVSLYIAWDKVCVSGEKLWTKKSCNTVRFEVFCGCAMHTANVIIHSTTAGYTLLQHK